MLQQTLAYVCAAIVAAFAMCGCQLATPASAPQGKSHVSTIPPAPMPLAAKPTKTPPRILKAKQAAAQSAATRSPAAQPTSAKAADSDAAPSTEEMPQNAVGPQVHNTYYRLDKLPAKIPPVTMTKGNEAICRAKVGDKMPPIALPKLGGGEEVKLANLYGKNATVVVFWKADRRMTTQLLTDLDPEVLKPFGSESVHVVDIAVQEKEADAKAALEKYGARSPNPALTNLLDADGKAFAQLGSDKLPRIYVLDSSGKIAWFDIEYSLTTRRELNQVLRAMTDGK